MSRRDNHPDAATDNPHPDCRAPLIQIVAPHFGGGEEERGLRELVERLRLGHLIEMQGFVQSGEICSALGASLALLLLSIEEQFGFAVIEAQALGVPVIVSDQCGVRDEFVRTAVNGFVVEPDNIEGTAKWMLQLARNEALWREMSSAAARFVGRADASHFAEAVIAFARADGADVMLSPEKLASNGRGLD